VPVISSPLRAPASDDALTEEQRLEAEKIRNHFLPFTYRTEKMIQYAIDHITPGLSHDVDAEDPPDTSLNSRRGEHNGAAQRYNPIGPDGRRSPRCLQAVNDAAIEAGWFTQRIESGSACRAEVTLNSLHTNLLALVDAEEIDLETATLSTINEARWKNITKQKNWLDSFSDPRMAPRGAILLYEPAAHLGTCADIRGRRGHIEIKTADSGSHGYVSISESDRPAYNLPRTLIGVYIKMTELDYEDVNRITNDFIRNELRTRIEVNFNQEYLGQGDDIMYGGSRRLSFKRKDCLREARSVLFHSKRAYWRLKNRRTMQSLDKIKSDINIALDKLSHDQEEDYGSDFPGDNTTWGIESCVQEPAEHISRLRRKLTLVQTELNRFPIEDYQENIFFLLRELTGITMDGSTSAVPSPIAVYYNKIRANNDDHLSDQEIADEADDHHNNE